MAGGFGEKRLPKERGGEKMRLIGKWRADIGLSLACEFGTGEKKLIMKLFESSIDHQIKEAKKSHRIVLVCWWKNIGCRPKDPRPDWSDIKNIQEELNKARKPYGAGVSIEVKGLKKGGRA